MHCAWFLNIVGLGIVVKEASLKYTIQESDNGLDYAYMSKKPTSIYRAVHATIEVHANSCLLMSRSAIVSKP